jgi:HK97 family phage major capsid protein
MSNLAVEIEQARNDAAVAADKMEQALHALNEADPDLDPNVRSGLQESFDAAEAAATKAIEHRDRLEKLQEQRSLIFRPGDTSTPIPAEGATTSTASNSNVRINVRREPLTYEMGGRHSFFRDVWSTMTQPGAAGPSERLKRHMHEMAVEQRDISSTDGAGGDFVPPLWMMNEWIALARASRPLGNIVRRFPLPQGTDSINLPRVSTGAAVAIQTADNAAVQETDVTTGSLSIPVVTIAGQQDVSRQLLERSQPGIDQILFSDLAADYATKLDVQLISGSGSSGQIKGVLTASGTIAVTYTDATPTVGELYSKIADAAQQMYTQRFAAPTAMIMHPRRWAWFLAAVDTQNRPLVVPNANNPMNAMGTFSGQAAEGPVGSIQGIPVYLDASIPTNLGAGTNEDRIIITRVEDLYLFEDGAPRTRVFEEVLSATLTVRLQVYGYAAFTAERYGKSTAIIAGTGLIAPTF